MDNLFLKYMNERTGKTKDSGHDFDKKGPVITISREHGCFASKIALMLSETLTQKNVANGKDVPWRFISKEIIEESAKELKLSPELTEDLTEYRTRGFFENIALFFSDSFYPGDVKIRNTIARFIYNAATEGNVIIIGRAAEAHTKNFDKSFHVKLVAPLEWRAKHLSDTMGMSVSEAKKDAMEIDKRRKQFRNYFEKNRPDVDYYDAFFNSSTMTDEEIVEMIVIAAETRGFI
jgi:cytidylate kinase